MCNINKEKRAFSSWIFSTYNLVPPHGNGNDGLAENECEMKMAGGNLSVCCVIGGAGDLLLLSLYLMRILSIYFISRKLYYFQARIILPRPRLWWWFRTSQLRSEKCSWRSWKRLWLPETDFLNLAELTYDNWPTITPCRLLVLDFLTISLWSLRENTLIWP